MIYLESITLLNYILKKLNAEKRDQVPTSVIPEIKQVMSVATTKIGAEPTLVYKIAYDDLLEAMSTAAALKGMQNLTDRMKQTLVDGIMTLKLELCTSAYEYYGSHDFEVTDTIIPVMREIVRFHLLGG